MSKRLTELDRMRRDEMRDYHLLMIVDTDEKVSQSVTLGDLRDYMKYGPRGRTGFRKRPIKHIFETPQKESFWKRLQRLFLP